MASKHTGKIVQVLNVLLEKERVTKDAFKMITAVSWAIECADTTKFDFSIQTAKAHIGDRIGDMFLLLPTQCDRRNMDLQYDLNSIYLLDNSVDLIEKLGYFCVAVIFARKVREVPYDKIIELFDKVAKAKLPFVPNLVRYN